ncbi:polysaccharide deacetylase family protein [Streptomyces sp. MMBL 11-1]|uniref:polysaccharide deacetylase family protein n=1 Tax=Streptomyces sp. MMBL 11-1 TaxID=3026420 RepID=UPI00235F3794|nr:polysaccharide deacetylase family protein [Streptomyces sp. MMBL 11-1]
MPAVGYTSGDPRKVNDTGDTLTGPLVLSGGAANLTVGGSGSISGGLSVAGRLESAGFALPAHYPGRPTPVRQPSRIVEHFQTGHGWATSGGVASSELNDTTDFCKGTQSAKVVFSGNGNLDKSGISSMDLTGKAIRFVVKVDDVSKLSQLNIRVGTSATNVFQWQTLATTATSKLYKSGEWTTVTVGWSDVHSAAGTFSLDANRVPSAKSGFTFIRFQVVATGGNCTVHFQSVEIIDAITATFPNGVVSITFDDSWDSQYALARPKMDQYGYRGTFYTIAQSIGAANRMTLAQLRTMQDQSGMEIAGHAYTNAMHDGRFTNFTARQVDDELRNLRSWLLSNGLRGDNFAYPGGNFENTIDGVPVEQIVARYFATGRTVLTGYGSSTNVLKEQWPPPRPYRMLAQSAISGASVGMDLPASVTQAGGSLDVCKRQGAWLQLTFHVLTTGSEGGDAGVIKQSDFNSIIDAINSYGIPVLPVADVMRYTV